MDHTLICLYIPMYMYTGIHWHVYNFVYLCVHFSSGSEFGISQHRLGNAVETTAVFFKTMITSCPASAASQNLPPLSLRELCVCRYIQVYACAPACMACMHICVASQCIKRNTPCVAFSSLYRASPLSHVIMENPTASHTSEKTQSPVWIVQRLRNSAEDGEIYPREWTCFDTQPKSLTKHKAHWFIFFGPYAFTVLIIFYGHLKPKIQRIPPHCLSTIQGHCSYSFYSIHRERCWVDLHKSIMFYMEIHLVKRLSKSKGRLGHLSRGRLSHLNV